MYGKVLFVVGGLVGYVIGTRQGREGYERLKKQATDLWENPKVQRTVSDAQKFAEEKIPGFGKDNGDSGTHAASGSGMGTGMGSGSSGPASTGSTGTGTTGTGASGTGATGTTGTGTSTTSSPGSTTPGGTSSPGSGSNG